MKKYVILALVLGITILVLAACGQSKENSSETAEGNGMVITAEEAKEFMDSSNDYVLLDVREQDEYEEGHIKGATLIPYTELETRAESELPDKEKTILVYCRSGRRSAIAAKTLVTMGYTDVRDFGGIINWPYDIEQ